MDNSWHPTIYNMASNNQVMFIQLINFLKVFDNRWRVC